MWCGRKIYGRYAGPLTIVALLLNSHPLYPQQKNISDTISGPVLHKVTALPFPISLSPFSGPEIYPDSLVESYFNLNGQVPGIFDSLKIKAGRYVLTRKLYDLLIVSHKPSSPKDISEPSEAGYLKYSGMIIRKIQLQRLNVFGSDINDPLVSNPTRLDNFLNKTHLNTNEYIIRKNLLFSPGDTVSPMIISDNERILRDLPFIDDSRIVIIPVSEKEADVIVITRDLFSLGAAFDYTNIKKGTVSVFEKNLLGLGHEFSLEIPYDKDKPDSPGFELKYDATNIGKSFINMDIYYFNGLGVKTYGVDLDRKLLSFNTKYAGGISIREMFTTEDLDTLTVPQPLKYNLQDYWLSRSFLLDRENVTRLIFGVRYTNNNVFNHPFILPDSYFNLQKHRMFLGSISLSMQKYYKTSLIYGYGRTEDVPYGGLIDITGGREIGEFKNRTYSGLKIAAGQSVKGLGYFYGSTAFSTFFHNGVTEQGQIQIKSDYFSNLIYIGRYRMRNFVKFDYTRGFGRNTDEFLSFKDENGFSGFRNDSIGSTQRVTFRLESVLFSPGYYYGFRFAYFAFTDFGTLFGKSEFNTGGVVLTSIGLGIRIRNDNLVFNTFQIRLGFFPNLPLFSRVSYLNISGEQMLRPDNFDPGPPSILPYQ